MAKKYNLGSKSDMRRFERDLKNAVMNQAESAIRHSSHEVICPNCKRKLNAHIGSNTCPFCKQLITLQLNM